MRKLISYARTTEVDDTSDRLLEAYNKETGFEDEAVLDDIFLDMKPQSEELTEAIKRDITYSQMEDADADRDNWGRRLARALVGYASLPIEELSRPAARLLEVFDKYGLKMLRENYVHQSSLMESMLLDFSAPACVEDAKLLPGIPELIAGTRASQTSFTEKRVAYEKAFAMAKNLPTATELKAPLVELINAKLVPYLQVMRKMNPDKYEHLAGAVEKIIADTNDVITRRSKSATDKPVAEE